MPIKLSEERLPHFGDDLITGGDLVMNACVFHGLER
jgi:hypothetical protein